MKYIFSKNKNQKGFSLLEVAIAVSIITIGFIGVSSLSNQSLQVEQTNRNTIIASMLAQEGLEIVRNIRDENWLEGRDFKDGLIDSQGFDYDYRIDRAAKIVIPNIDHDNAILKINPTTKMYGHAGGEDSIFRRMITTSDNGNNLEVTCLVQWNERGKIKQYKTSTQLYDWR